MNERRAECGLKQDPGLHQLVGFEVGPAIYAPNGQYAVENRSADRPAELRPFLPRQVHRGEAGGQDAKCGVVGEEVGVAHGRAGQRLKPQLAVNLVRVRAFLLGLLSSLRRQRRGLDGSRLGSTGACVVAVAARDRRMSARVAAFI